MCFCPRYYYNISGLEQVVPENKWFKETNINRRMIFILNEKYPNEQDSQIPHSALKGNLR